VTGGVTEHEMHSQMLGHESIDAFEQREELGRAVALAA
jgi:hypothetical protein